MGPTGGKGILQLHPTRRCNLHCRHCYSESGPRVDAATPLPVLQRVVADAAVLGYTVVGISGGEPMLYKPLPELLRTAKQHGMSTTVTSNGILLTQRNLAALAGLVDVLAISLDGVPASHDRMRGDSRAFRTLHSRMQAVRASGIPFGFITTLTMHNVDELDFVVRYAAAQGASLVQVHPLELVGAAINNLTDAIPDSEESAFALLEGARLSRAYSIPVQVDLVRQADLHTHPAQFLAVRPDPSYALGQWLTPLVVETDGTVVPMTYGFPRRYALGNATSDALTRLAASWNPGPLLTLCARVADDLMNRRASFFNWYDELCTAARTDPQLPLPTLTAT
jgi:MoaA/NifB/PqqE/SkfB family radical SAM enzyme